MKKYDDFVSFKVGRELYALNIGFVQKIEDSKEIREIPNTDEEVLGIIDFQGEQIVPIVDLRTLFNIYSEKKEEIPFIIIANVNDVWLGLVVDEVDEVIKIVDKKISLGNLTEAVSGKSNEYIQGIYRKAVEGDNENDKESTTKKEEKLLIILNPEKLIERKKLDALKEVTKQEEE